MTGSLKYSPVGSPWIRALEVSGMVARKAEEAAKKSKAIFEKKLNK